MTQFATREELDILKDQMQVLKSHLSQNEVISQKMLEITFQNKVKHNAARKSMNILSILAGVIIIGVFAYTGFVKGTFSTGFTIVSILWGLLCTIIGVYRYKLNTRELLLSKPLTESVSSIMTWKKENYRSALATTLGLIVWLPYCLTEIWGDISTNIDHAVVVGLIIILPLVFSYNHYRKVSKITNELLDKIQELKNS